MKTCPWCHHQFENDVTVCPHDGENLIAVARQPMRTQEFGQESRVVVAADDEGNVKELRNVRASSEAELQSDSQAVPIDQTTAPLSTFNPWKIAVPALIVLLVCFGVFYAVQPRTIVEVTPALPTDPLGIPAQSLPPATGESERELTIRQEQPADANTSPIAPPTTATSVNARVLPPEPGQTFPPGTDATVIVSTPVSREAPPPPQQPEGKAQSADKSDGAQTPQQRNVRGNNTQQAEELPTTAPPAKAAPTPKAPAPPSPSSETLPK